MNSSFYTLHFLSVEINVGWNERALPLSNSVCSNYSYLTLYRERVEAFAFCKQLTHTTYNCKHRCVLFRTLLHTFLCKTITDKYKSLFSLLSYQHRHPFHHTDTHIQAILPHKHIFAVCIPLESFFTQMCVCGNVFVLCLFY